MAQYKFAMLASQGRKSIHDTSFGCIGPNDVLLGRGGAANNHIGNRMFRAIVLRHQLEYLQSKKLDKIKVAYKIVATIQEQGGRFLKPIGGDDTWEEVEQKKAIGKASQALREGLDVRHAQIRLPKKSTSTKSSSSSSSTSISSSNDEASVPPVKTRKPYTIRNPLTQGKVRTTTKSDTPTFQFSNVNAIAVPTNIMPAEQHQQLQQQIDLRNVNILALAALLQGSSYHTNHLQLERVL